MRDERQEKNEIGLRLFLKSNAAVTHRDRKKTYGKQYDDKAVIS